MYICDFSHCNLHIFMRNRNDEFRWNYPEGELYYLEKVVREIRNQLFK